MFIIRLGVEALKNSDLSLSHIDYTDNIKHSILEKIKCRHQFELKKDGMKLKINRPKRKGILYNLLKQNKHKEETIKSSSKSVLTDRPSSLNSEVLTPQLLGSNDSRPSSAPHMFKFQSGLQVKNISSNECMNISREKLMFDWLRNIMEISRCSQPNEFNNLFAKFYCLSNLSKLIVLKQCWHLLFVTYLAEFVQNSCEDVKLILSFLIKDYNKSMGNVNYKKNFRITRMFTGDLEQIVLQIVSLRMNPSLYNLFRVTILGIISETDDFEKIKTARLFKSCLSYQSEEIVDITDQLLDNLSRLDISLMESTFYGHLTSNVEAVLDDLYWQ